jgi:Carboxypeptidase regulatory-like domain
MVLRSLLLAVALLLVTTSARAGEYVVSGCHGPGSADAAWGSLTSGAGDTSARCDAPGDALSATVAGPDGDDQRGASARWRFTAPDDTTLVGLDLQRRVRVAAGSPPPPESGWSPSAFTYTLNLGGVVDACADEGCDGLWQDVTARHDPPGPATATFGVACNPCAIGGAAAADVTVGAVHLWDGIPPLVGTPSGPLFDDAGAPGGEQAFEAGAVDRGSGLYAAALEVDGTVRASWPFAPGDAICATPFVALVPCALAGTGRWSFDTSGLAVGAHRARVLVRDAGGGTSASASATIRVTAPAPPPTTTTATTPATTPTTTTTTTTPTTTRATPVAALGAPAPAPAPAAASTVALPGKIIMSIAGHTTTTVAFGARPLLAGRLVDATGAPLARAVVALTARPLGRGLDRAWTPAGTATTDAAGRFRVRVPAGGSRELRAVAAVGAQAVVRVEVRAGVRFSIPARARRGVTIALRGTVAQTAGKLVELQARDGAVWRTFATVRTDARGAFRRAFRFHRPGPSARYALRARVPAEAGFAFRTATSAARWISVR